MIMLWTVSWLLKKQSGWANAVDGRHHLAQLREGPWRARCGLLPCLLFIVWGGMLRR